MVPFSETSLKFGFKFKCLRFFDLCLTQDDFVGILQANLFLYRLTLSDIDIVERSTQSLLQHTGVKEFSANIEGIARMGATSGQSLLSHFPNLKCLCTWQDDTYLPIATAKFKEDITHNYPHLIAYELEEVAGPVVALFCTHISRNVAELTIGVEFLSIREHDHGFLAQDHAKEDAGVR